MLKLLKSIFQSRRDSQNNERLFAKKSWKINPVFRIIDFNTEGPYQPTLWEQDWVLNEQ